MSPEMRGASRFGGAASGDIAFRIAVHSKQAENVGLNPRERHGRPARSIPPAADPQRRRHLGRGESRQRRGRARHHYPRRDTLGTHDPAPRSSSSPRPAGSLDRSQTVEMEDLTIEEVGHGGEADMRMRANVEA